MKRDGRWTLNNGSEMLLTIPDLAPGKDDSGNPLPIRAVVDLETLRPMAPRIVALRDHDPHRPVGSFHDFAISIAEGVSAAFDLAKPSAEGALIDAREIGDLLAAEVPLQASLGAEPGPSGSWQRIADGQSVIVNGKPFQGGGSAPLYVLRGGRIFETSVVTFGADDQTGKMAASSLILRRLLPMLSAGFCAHFDALPLTKRAHTIASIKGSLAASGARILATTDHDDPRQVANRAERIPGTVTEAMQMLKEEGVGEGRSKRGDFLHQVALQRWPNLDRK